MLASASSAWHSRASRSGTRVLGNWRCSRATESGDEEGEERKAEVADAAADEVRRRSGAASISLGEAPAFKALGANDRGS